MAVCGVAKILHICAGELGFSRKPIPNYQTAGKPMAIHDSTLLSTAFQLLFDYDCDRCGCARCRCDRDRRRVVCGVGIRTVVVRAAIGAED